MFLTEFIYTPPYGSPDGYDVFAKLDRADRILGQRGSGGLAQVYSHTTGRGGPEGPQRAPGSPEPQNPLFEYKLL